MNTAPWWSWPPPFAAAAAALRPWRAVQEIRDRDLVVNCLIDLGLRQAEHRKQLEARLGIAPPPEPRHLHLVE